MHKKKKKQPIAPIHPDCNQEQTAILKQLMNHSMRSIYFPIHGIPCHMIGLKQESWDKDDWGHSESAHKVPMTCASWENSRGQRAATPQTEHR